MLLAFVLLLSLDTLDLQFLPAALLSGLGFLDCVRQFGLRGSGVDLLVVGGFLRLEVALGRGDRRVGLKARSLALLISEQHAAHELSLGSFYNCITAWEERCRGWPLSSNAPEACSLLRTPPAACLR